MDLKVKVKHAYTYFKNDSFLIADYIVLDDITLPDGSTPHRINAKGYSLPEYKDLQFYLTGALEKKTYKGKTKYTLNVTSVEEIVPSEEDGIIKYLQTINGIGKATAYKLFHEFAGNVFNIIENDIEELIKVKGINKRKAEKIQNSFLIRKDAKELFEFLFRYKVSEKKILKVFKKYGASSLSLIKSNPYLLTEVAQIGFYTADTIALEYGVGKTSTERIKAAICEVLLEGEVQGPLFNINKRFPSFCYNEYLGENLFDLLVKGNFQCAGSVFLPRDIVYLLTLKLLGEKISADTFDEISMQLHREKKIFLSRQNKTICFYRFPTASAEFKSAKHIARLQSAHISPIKDIDTKIANAEKREGILLSEEQKDAIKTSLSSPISVITGGAGTGKTSVQKILLAVYKATYPHNEIKLMSPTGMAAKRMSDSTGYPAATIHSALGIFGEDAENVSSDLIESNLILVDEASMIDAHLMNVLMSKIGYGSQVVFIGDVDQLPSVGAGCVLREIISSNEIPVSILTKVFRQVEGSIIAINAARIKTGETKLMYDNGFTFTELGNSDEILNEIKRIYPKLVADYGLENVAVLSPLRKRTATGVNALNLELRNLINPNTKGKNSIDNGFNKFFIDDKVIYTKNNSELGLVNGDIGYVSEIQYSDGEKKLIVKFGETAVEFVDEEIQYLELAYSTTVHKSQGQEYAIVILIIDRAHQIMLKKNLIYTGCSRAKKNLILLGQFDAFEKGINSEETSNRYSNLGVLISKYINKPQGSKESTEEETQISIAQCVG